MYLNRRYRKLQWFDFLDQIELELKELPAKERYIEILDEIRLRKLESVSEGATYKMKVPSKDLVLKFEQRMASDSSFATPNDLQECRIILEEIL